MTIHCKGIRHNFSDFFITSWFLDLTRWGNILANVFGLKINKLKNMRTHILRKLAAFLESFLWVSRLNAKTR